MKKEARILATIALGLVVVLILSIIFNDNVSLSPRKNPGAKPNERTIKTVTATEFAKEYASTKPDEKVGMEIKTLFEEYANNKINEEIKKDDERR